MTKKKVKCLIIDDEELAIKVIASYVEKVPSLELIATCQNAFDAFNVLNKESIDLIFLDIQMPQLTGLEFIKALNKSPQIIITTAYREYAPEGFELDVTDYLLKPVAFSRFLKAIGKITPTKEVATPDLVEREVDYRNASIFVKCGKTMEKVWYRDVFYIESFRDYVSFHTTKKKINTYVKISALGDRLPEDLFLRIHKSFIINTDKIEAFSTSQVEINGQKLPIGNFYKKQVMERLEKDGSQL